jgi:hypothetical protein
MRVPILHWSGSGWNPVHRPARICRCSKVLPALRGGRLHGARMNRAKRRNLRAANDPPAETSEELRERLPVFAELTGEHAMRRATVPFPEGVTVLAGPLREVRRRG